MPSVLDYLHVTARQPFGRFFVGTTTGAGTPSSLVCSRLVNVNLSASEYGNWFVLLEDGSCAGQMGTVGPNGLDTATGTLTIGETLTDAVAAGVTFSLYDCHRLPPLDGTRLTSLLQILNNSLERIWVEDTLTIPGVTSQYHYTIDAAAYPWLSDDIRIIDVQYPVTAADDVPRALPRTAWAWLSDGETRRLRFFGAPFATGESFTVKVNRPANTRLKLTATARATVVAGAITAIAVVLPGFYLVTPTVTVTGGGGSATATAHLTGTALTSITVGGINAGYTSTPTVTVSAGDWADQATQTAGLQGLADEAIPDVGLVRPIMLALGYEALAEHGQPGATVSEWLAKADRWMGIAAGVKTRRAPRDANAGLVRVNAVAVGGRRWGSTWGTKGLF